MKTAIKYAPQSLGDVIYPSLAVQTRIDAYANKALEGNILLWGPNGTGKSTAARLLPVAIGGAHARIEHKDMEELVRMKNLRTYLQSATSVIFLEEGEKLFIVAEELDTLKGDFANFWKALDAVQDRVMLIVTTNDAMNIHKSLRSRCGLINFPALSARQVLTRAQLILQSEDVHLSDQQVLYWLQLVESTGDLRDYMNKLDELIYLARNGLALPPLPTVAKSAQCGLSVVPSKKK